MGCRSFLTRDSAGGTAASFILCTFCTRVINNVVVACGIQLNSIMICCYKFNNLLDDSVCPGTAGTAAAAAAAVRGERSNIVSAVMKLGLQPHALLAPSANVSQDVNEREIVSWFQGTSLRFSFDSSHKRPRHARVRV